MAYRQILRNGAVALPKLFTLLSLLQPTLELVLEPPDCAPEARSNLLQGGGLSVLST